MGSVIAHPHKRSNIEATNAAIKRKFGVTSKSKNLVAQVNELLAKIACSVSNIRTLNVTFSVVPPIRMPNLN